MDQRREITDGLQEVMAGEPWYGPSLETLLASLDADTAWCSPAMGRHRIVDLVLHLDAWQRLVLARLDSPRHLEMAPEVNWPEAGEASEEIWQRYRRRLEEGHLRLLTRISSLSPEEQAATVPGLPWSVHEMLRGLIQHHVYHAGQIAQLASRPRD
ncbi:MAG: DinB family protein [Acidobacteriota bacterium]